MPDPIDAPPNSRTVIAPHELIAEVARLRAEVGRLTSELATATRFALRFNVLHDGIGAALWDFTPDVIPSDEELVQQLLRLADDHEALRARIEAATGDAAVERAACAFDAAEREHGRHDDRNLRAAIAAALEPA